MVKRYDEDRSIIELHVRLELEVSSPLLFLSDSWLRPKRNVNHSDTTMEDLA
jgi:hypothetical protein